MNVRRVAHLCCVFGLLTAFVPESVRAEVVIEVGIVQRFGDEKTDQLEIESTTGELDLKFSQQGQSYHLSTEQLEIAIAPRPLFEPQLREHIVLSDRATFETAEHSAKQWEALGIEVEVVQPGRWQVWAAREVYRTPLLRRWLLSSLLANGYTLPYLETQWVDSLPEITFVVDGQRYAAEKLEIEVDGEAWVEENGQRYRYPGDLVLQPNAYGDYTLVNEVEIEAYLRGVVPYEIAPIAPPEAIAAQAILARTYALRNLRRFAADNYQLCATVHCQVYRGTSGALPKVDRAIAATQGLVLTHNSELVDALYSSTTGGVTAAFSDIWDGQERPYLRPILDAPTILWDIVAQPLDDEAAFRRFIALDGGFNETGTGAFRWRRQGTLEQLSEDLGKYLERTKHPLADFEQLQRLAIIERSPSGRILQLNAYTDKGAIALYKTEVRSAFTPPRSTLFYLEPIIDDSGTLDGYTFVGGGFGHGVGLSQYGSYHLARLGWTAEEILAFYYPGTQIQPLDGSIVFYDGD